MSNFYSTYAFPNTPFVFDKVYTDEETANGLNNKAKDDGVFITRYILVDKYEGENKVVFQKRLGENNQAYYQKIVSLDQSGYGAILSDLLANYEGTILTWKDLDKEEN